MARGAAVLFLFAVAVVGQALTPTTYFTQADQERLRRIFGQSAPIGNDMESVYYSVLGFTLLDEMVPEGLQACEAAKKVDSNDVDSLFYASSIAQNLKAVNKVTCPVPLGKSDEVLTKAITAEASTLTIYHAVAALVNLGFKIDAAKVTAAVDAALKADDTPLSHAYAFYAVSHLSGDLKKYHDLIEDIVAQADEVDDKYLQFEGGIFTTSLVVDSAYQLAKAAKKAPTFTDAGDSVIKFANYLLSRKHVQSLKNSAAVLSAIKTLTNNDFHVPVVVSLASQVSVSEQNPVVQVRVSNLLGASLGKVMVTADTARHIGDDAVVLSKKPLSASTADASLFELDFMKIKPARGFYKVTLSLTPSKPDQRLLGTAGAEIEVKVTTQVAIEEVEIGVADREQSTASRTTKLQHPNKAANVLEADNHQKITMKFTLKDKLTNEMMTAHQVFVRLTNVKTSQEIFFVPETDNSDVYRFDLDVGERAKDFGYLSGKYSMDLIIGDSVIQNPVFWTVAEASLSFPEGPTSEKEDDPGYSKRPEILHKFREPEKRPPSVVSNLFTALVLSPILVLVALWLKMGANISNFPASLSAIGFHLGLGAIFVLYYFYWVQLNMFDTLRYLGLIGIPTFLFGNRLLSGIAAKRK